VSELKGRRPTSPGEILREEFLKPLRMTQRELAGHLSCDIKVINRIVNGRSAVTAEMALKLAATFATTADFWLNAQTAVDLYTAQRRLKRLPRALHRPIGRKDARDGPRALREA
jgi:addiction module HigA family antidote